MFKKDLLAVFIVLFSSCEKQDKNNQNIYKKFDNPIITDNDFFIGARWNDPCVIEDNGKFVMYASADRNISEDIKIYRLISDNGEGWEMTPDTAIFQKNETPGAWDRKSTETPAVVYFNNKYHLFYTGYPENMNNYSSYKIGHATSDDGIHFTRDESYLLAPTAPGELPNLDFNQYIVAEPAPVIFNNKIYLYFTASGASQEFSEAIYVIGLITSPDGENWSDPEMVLEPEQEIYPRSIYAGYSTPHATVIENKVHLFFDVAIDPFQQIYIHRAVSEDGKTNWEHDEKALIYKDDFKWTTLEINGPSALVKDEKVYLWFAGNNNKNLGIGLVIYYLAQ